MTGGRRSSGEDGFTLVELLVVVVVVGILAAIALPAFVSHRARAQDAAAKSDAKNLMTHVETCTIGSAGDDDCSSPETLGTTGLNIGTSPGEVTVTGGGDDDDDDASASASASGDGDMDGDDGDDGPALYVVTAFSRSGAVFSVSKGADGLTRRTCGPDGGVGGCAADGTW